jgi:DNA-binding protein H-NS
MPDWEYRKLHLNQHTPRGDELDMLNAAGRQGWELVSITSNNVAYLKREIDDFDQPRTETGQHAMANASPPARSRTDAVLVKYRDPVTNETWSGRGRMPNWLKRKQEAGEDIEEYLVRVPRQAERV